MSFGTAYATKKHNKKCMAKGGEVEMQDPMPQDDGSANMNDADMIARIMHKRNQYAKGGVVANDVGVAEADKLPAEFDDLVLDDNLEDDSGAGNEIGDARVHDDMVDRIMLKKQKDKLPRPA